MFSMDDLKRFVLTLRVRSTKYTVVEQCAIFARMIEGTVVQGWAESMGTYCRHYWVEKDAAVYDVGKAYSALFEPSLVHIPLNLVKTIDENQSCIDDKEAVAQRNKELFELYTGDPKAFWKGVKPFRGYKR
jgi:hypothetical protein